MIILRNNIEQKEFARADYEGLDESQKAKLKEYRSAYAKDLNEARNKFNNLPEDLSKKGNREFNYNLRTGKRNTEIKINSGIKGLGDRGEKGNLITSKISRNKKLKDVDSLLINDKSNKIKGLNIAHKKAIRKTLLNNSDAKKVMREHAIVDGNLIKYAIRKPKANKENYKKLANNLRKNSGHILGFGSLAGMLGGRSNYSIYNKYKHKFR